MCLQHLCKWINYPQNIFWYANLYEPVQVVGTQKVSTFCERPAACNSTDVSQSLTFMQMLGRSLYKKFDSFSDWKQGGCTVHSWFKEPWAQAVNQPAPNHFTKASGRLETRDGRLLEWACIPRQSKGVAMTTDIQIGCQSFTVLQDGFET